MLEPVAGVVQCVEYSLYQEGGVGLDFHNIGRMIEQEVDLFQVRLGDIAERIVGRGERTLATLLSHARDAHLTFSFGKTIDTFQALAEWLEVDMETRLLTYSLWDHRFVVGRSVWFRMFCKKVAGSKANDFSKDIY